MDLLECCVRERVSGWMALFREATNSASDFGLHEGYFREGLFRGYSHRALWLLIQSLIIAPCQIVWIYLSVFSV